MARGGSVEKRHEEIAVRRGLISDFIKDNPNKPLKYTFISSMFDVGLVAIRNDCCALSEVDNNFILSRGAVMYIPPTRYSDKKNDEGYNDPTAAAAIGSVEPKVIKMNAENVRGPKPGDVWNVKCASGDVHKFLVIAVNEDRDYVTCVAYEAEHNDMIESCKKLYSKPVKYFVERTWGTPLSLLTEYKNAIRDYLGIDPEDKVVEKIVEKEVPVEVPVPEVRVSEPVSSGRLYTQEELDMEIIKMRAEVYKECLYLMAGAARPNS